MKIICKNCSFENPVERTKCILCGHDLSDSNFSTEKIHNIKTEELGEAQPLPPPQSLLAPQANVSIYLLAPRVIIPLEGKNEFVLGRETWDEAQSEVDVDLTAYEGFQLGVSRKHCVIKTSDQASYVIDLNSSNGTFVNNAKIPPYEETRINHGDVVSMGLLRFQFLMKDTGRL